MRDAGLGGDGQPVRHGLHDLRRADIALVVAAEGGHHAEPRHRHAGGEMRRGLLAHRLQVLGMAAVEVLAGEASEAASEIDPVIVSRSAKASARSQPVLVEP